MSQKFEVQSGKELILYIVRHGKTFFNTTDQTQGFSDSPLTEDGIEQALKLGKGMMDIEFIKAFSSDLGRQRATAKYILSQNKKKIPALVELYGLREWCFGGFEGRSNKDMWQPIYEKYNIDSVEREKNYRQLVALLGYEKVADELFERDILKKAEKYDVIVNRLNEAMADIISESYKECEKAHLKKAAVLIVSSGLAITTMLHIFAKEQYKEELISNCSVSILKYKDAKFDLTSVADLSYLNR